MGAQLCLTSRCHQRQLYKHQSPQQQQWNSSRISQPEFGDRGRCLCQGDRHIQAHQVVWEDFVGASAGDAVDECGGGVGGGSTLRRTIGDSAGAAGENIMLTLVVIVMLCY